MTLIFFTLLRCEVRAGASQEIKDCQLGLAQAFADNSLLVGVELLRQADQTAEILIDVEAASVVLGDPLFDLLNEL